MKQAVDFFKVIYIDSNPGNGGKMPERNVNIKEFGSRNAGDL